MINEYALPQYLWAEDVNIVCYIINMVRDETMVACNEPQKSANRYDLQITEKMPPYIRGGIEVMCLLTRALK